MRHVNTVAALSGPLVLVAYLTVAAIHVYANRRSVEHRSHPAGRGTARQGAPTELVDAMAALVVATIAWRIISWVAPAGSSSTSLVGTGSTTSSIAAFSAQVLTVWQSVALWTGLAAVVGSIAPIFGRFRGGSGLAAAASLTFVYAPTVLMGAMAGYFLGLLFVSRPRDAVPAGLFAGITIAWLTWWFDTNPGWGNVNGPEISLWTTVTAGILFSRWWQIRTAEQRTDNEG